MPQASIPKLGIEEYEDDTERVAATARAYWRLPQGPVQDLTALMEQAGIIIIHSPLGGQFGQRCDNVCPRPFANNHSK